MIFSPWFWLAAAIAVGGAYGVGHHKGYVEKDQEDQVIIAKANEDARNKEQAANKKVSDIETQRRKDNARAQTEISKRDAAIADNKLQLFIRTKASVPTSTDAKPTGGSDTGTAQLDPTFARSIVAITDDGDTAIRKLNACIATYNQVKELINGSQSTR